MTAAQTMPTNGSDLDLALARDALLEWLGSESPEDLATLLEWFCDQGHGHWQNPVAAPHSRPATHLVEIDLLGVTATGATPEDAANNWRRCAQNMIDGGK